MEYDRKSAVSSFYGARRSIDVLNDVPTPVSPNNLPRGAARPRAESQSSFYADRQSRTSHDILNTQSAGYNASSFFAAGRQEPLKGGRDEEEERGQPGNWDVFADFNNAGPRYSTTFGIGQHQGPVWGKNSYHRLQPTTPMSKPESDRGGATAPVELATVPALGAEWERSEMKNMTRSGRREIKNEERRAQWRAWNRGEIGLCGTKWFTKKFLVFFIFACCAIIAIVLAITIPRVPAVSFYSAAPLVAATGDFNASIPTEFSRSPANFSFAAFAEIQLDTTTNIIPLTFNHISAQVYYPPSTFQVGTGNFGRVTLPAHSFPVIQIPLNFSYVAPNDTDPTWVAWYNACKNPETYTSGTRPGVSFEIILTMDIQGLPSQSMASAQVDAAACPIELSLSSG